MSNADLAVACFQEEFLCSQAILSTFCQQFGLGRDTALKLTEGFGAGMAGLGMTCGAVTGAFMVIGLKHGRTEASDKESKFRTAELIREFTKRFTARQDSIICKEILGYEIDTAEKVRIVRDKGLFETICPQAIRHSAEILEEILQMEIASEK